jgi:DNA invertase Pin-like site-specific DNA recombinase
MAAEHKDFVPLGFVFVDIGANRRGKRRRGFEMLTKLLLSDVRKLRSLYVDSIGRTGRSLDDTIQLSELVRRHNRTIVSCDGFDLESGKF